MRLSKDNEGVDYYEYMLVYVDDCLEIRTTFLKIGRVSLQLDQEVRVGAEIMFRAQVKLGVLNSIRNPSQLPTRIMDKIRQLGK